MDQIKEWASFGGVQRVFRHESESTKTQMEFAVYEPPASEHAPLVLYFLSGLTCTWENFVNKAGAQRAAAKYGITVVCPDTSPRGEEVPDRPDEYDLGQGAGFYINASEEPWSKHYRMEDYVRRELPSLIEGKFGVPAHRAISGHSMGGHGALTLAMKHPSFFDSASAFSPIVAPSKVPWGKKAFAAYLGEDEAAWRAHDACELVLDRQWKRPLLIDQGGSDQFLGQELTPELFQNACKNAEIDLTLRMQSAYDHSYFFIASFIEEHLAWHRSQAERPQRH